MKNQLIFCLLTGLLIIPLIFNGQTRVSQLPQKYLSPTSTVEAPKPDDALTDRPWFVWSDRANNPVYLNSDGNEKVTTLEFGAACAVLQAENDRLFIAKIEDIHNGFLQSGKETLGWVDYSKMLLWSTCLKTDDCFTAKKAFIINVSDLEQLNQTDTVSSFLYGPGNSYEVIETVGEKLIEMNFIFKETENYLLLGWQSTVYNNFDKTIVGWIPKKYCLIWNSNVALEINWEPEAVKERKEMQYPVMVWEELSDTEPHNMEAKLLFQETQPYHKRTPGFFNRFFLLDLFNGQSEFNNQPFKVGMITNVDNELDENDKNDSRIWLSIPKQVYQEGYTIFQPNEANYPWFKYVILLERRALEALRNTLRDLVMSKHYPPNIKRDRLFHSLVRMVQLCYGNPNSDTFNQVYFNELFFCVTCVVGKSKYNNLKITDFQNPRIVSDKVINELLNDLEVSLHAIEKILAMRIGKYPNIQPFRSNEIFYWIPLDIFPMIRAEILR
jgi:hypothetical protein